MRLELEIIKILDFYYGEENPYCGEPRFRHGDLGGSSIEQEWTYTFD